ncbi:MAG: hypothetical protein KAG94_05620 [Clostridiales bacterium]|nr:hypothetical protein [Clostridiales bacterium]
MSINEMIILTNSQIKRYEQLYTEYQEMSTNPKKASPKFIINTPSSIFTWEEMLEDSSKMLKNELTKVQTHIDLQDDRVLSTRVNFGTAQIAAAYGCDMYIPPNNLPCAKNHILTDIKNVKNLQMPSYTDGWYQKLKEFTTFFQENMPNHVFIQLPDIQSTFNSSHLIRGNDIIFDFYDNPELLGILLDHVTDYMIGLTKHLNNMIHHIDGWFFDYGAMWKGNGRISNCTVHLISPKMYEEHILERDKRFLKEIGGGRMHYCGAHPEIIDSFVKDNFITGLDFESTLHDLFTVSKILPENVPVLTDCDENSSLLNTLLSGKWPEKKNIILNIYANNMESGKRLLEKLRESQLKHL